MTQKAGKGEDVRPRRRKGNFLVSYVQGVRGDAEKTAPFQERRSERRKLWDTEKRHRTGGQRRRRGEIQTPMPDDTGGLDS